MSKTEAVGCHCECKCWTGVYPQLNCFNVFTHYRSSKCLSINSYNMIVLCLHIKSDFKHSVFCGFWPFLCIRMNYWCIFFPLTELCDFQHSEWCRSLALIENNMEQLSPHSGVCAALVPAKTRGAKLLSLCLLRMTQMRLKVLPVIVLVAGSWGDKGVVIETPRDENSNFVFHTQI